MVKFLGTPEAVRSALPGRTAIAVGYEVGRGRLGTV
jgi:hypothetical protein